MPQAAHLQSKGVSRTSCALAEGPGMPFVPLLARGILGPPFRP
ncbi:MAG: hypothetical protein WCG47_02560 [Dermatophilaceae bacterium]